MLQCEESRALGSSVHHEDQVTYLACLEGIITRQVNICAKNGNRIAAVRHGFLETDARFLQKIQLSYSLETDTVVYKSMLRSKSLYGLETLEIPQTLFSKLEAFQSVERITKVS